MKSITEKKLEEMATSPRKAVMSCAGDRGISDYEGPVVAKCDTDTYGYWKRFDDCILGNQPNKRMTDPAPGMSEVFTPDVVMLTEWMVACIYDPNYFSEEGYKSFIKAPRFTTEGGDSSPKFDCASCDLRFICKGSHMNNTLACRGARSQLRE